MSGFRHTNLGASKTHVPNSPGLRLRFQALLQVVKVKHRLRPEVDQKQQTRTPARLDIMFLCIYIYICILIINIRMGILLIYYTYMCIYMPRSGHIPNVVQISVDSLLLQGEANQATKQRLAVNCSFPAQTQLSKWPKISFPQVVSIGGCVVKEGLPIYRTTNPNHQIMDT